MPILPTQTKREISVKSVLGDDRLLFMRMRGSEALGRMFTYDVELASTKSDIKIADVLGTSMTVVLDLPAGGKRYFNGIITRFAYRGRRNGMASYHAVLHPAMWLLTRSMNCRIFQEKTAIEIIKAVCNRDVYAGLIKLDETKLSSEPASRSYCVQYRESDFNFITRLLVEEGIYYRFDHKESRHTMVLADGLGAHESIVDYATVQFRDDEFARAALEESVTRFAQTGEIQPSDYVLNDFDFEQVSKSASDGMLAKAKIDAAFITEAYEHYDYPGKYTAIDNGRALARARLESLHGQGETIEAFGTACGLTTGALFKLTDHPNDDQNRQFLIVAGTIEIAGTGYASGGDNSSTEFRFDFTAVGKEHSYRPQPMARKPVVQGPQTAMVVGKDGEEIWTDKYGRVKLQFHWERDGKSNETSSCFVRVQQGWAGKEWGMMFLPRIGMEVVVSFLEGDPDRPLVTGCVYNSDAMPAYTLPENQTRSGIKTNSSKGGGGFNEIRFEDKKSSEEIFIQAEKDFNRVVKNNDTLKVGFEVADKGDQTISIKNDQSLDVGNDQIAKIKHDQNLEVGNDQIAKIKNDQNTTISNSQILSVSQDQTVKINGKQEVKIATTSLIEANQSITLKVGASSIKIEPAKITIKSPEIAIEADGMIKIKAGAIVTIEGAMVKIN